VINPQASKAVKKCCDNATQVKTKIEKPKVINQIETTENKSKHKSKNKQNKCNIISKDRRPVIEPSFKYYRTNRQHLQHQNIRSNSEL